ncbi:hypothetical protein Hs30E_07010 [Lactococcus hodotermopsidis]|uniref:CENP-V/GFA domain-containing protein n=1 Tax=Pseudolactococcus hodotermopsidis TaxID=2709157 RepID=A0A6A0B9M2_9LACT|nr:hypothetical protein [Lactococcus hodotermopsidis]GFH42150.1 hypothetical protein Hs30E_07010 [Lactococcus hodotermopsidis]
MSRAFCQFCGTYLFYQNKNENAIYLNAELFDEFSHNAQLISHIFYDDKPDYYDFTNHCQKLTSDGHCMSNDD